MIIEKNTNKHVSIKEKLSFKNSSKKMFVFTNIHKQTHTMSHQCLGPWTMSRSLDQPSPQLDHQSLPDTLGLTRVDSLLKHQHPHRGPISGRGCIPRWQDIMSLGDRKMGTVSHRHTCRTPMEEDSQGFPYSPSFLSVMEVGIA